MTWQLYALLAAVAAAFTAILAKVGVQGVPPNVATAVRTAVVLVMALGIVMALGELSSVREVSKRSLVFLVLSGMATGASWLAYFKALSLAPASRVAPIDKLSLAFTLLFAVVVLREPLSWKLALGTALMTAGALLTLRA